jgi:hypothetical protein
VAGRQRAVTGEAWPDVGRAAEHFSGARPPVVGAAIHDLLGGHEHDKAATNELLGGFDRLIAAIDESFGGEVDVMSATDDYCGGYYPV